MIGRRTLRWPRFAGGLGFRLAMLLSVALLPLGVISVAQTLRVLSDARQTSETALIGLTADAVAGQRALIEGALGSARALGPVLAETFDRPAECTSLAEEFVRNSGFFAFAGFLSIDGTACVSEGAGRDFSVTQFLERQLGNPQTEITISDAGMVTGLPVLVISEPVWRQGALRGFVVLSVPYGAVDIVGRFGADESSGSAEITLLDENARPFMPSRGRETAAGFLPAGRDLTEDFQPAAQVFRGDTAAGDRATFVVVPVIPQRIYALGTWPRETTHSAWERGSVLALLFPFLMWFVSLSVAYFAVHRLVIRHVVHINGQMRRFAIGQREDFTLMLPGRAPAEFRQLNSTFTKLRRIISRDEAHIAAALNEKTVLLKEVHHRVKNNLQLIASILSMQMRKIDDPSLRQVLKSVQDRVMSLATIHRILYRSDRVADVRADRLLQELLHQSAGVTGPSDNIEITADLDPIRLYPDQVVPLSLLATEALTNAYKFMGRPANGRKWIKLSFKASDDDHVLLEVMNSSGTPTSERVAHDEQTSLGGHLIIAFARQLDATIEEGAVVTAGGPAFRLAVRFQAQGFLPPEEG